MQQISPPPIEIIIHHNSLNYLIFKMIIYGYADYYKIRHYTLCIDIFLIGTWRLCLPPQLHILASLYMGFFWLFSFDFSFHLFTAITHIFNMRYAHSLLNDTITGFDAATATHYAPPLILHDIRHLFSRDFFTPVSLAAIQISPPPLINIALSFIYAYFAARRRDADSLNDTVAAHMICRFLYFYRRNIDTATRFRVYNAAVDFQSKSISAQVIARLTSISTGIFEINFKTSIFDEMLRIATCIRFRTHSLMQIDTPTRRTPGMALRCWFATFGCLLTSCFDASFRSVYIWPIRLLPFHHISPYASLCACGLDAA